MGEQAPRARPDSEGIPHHRRPWRERQIQAKHIAEAVQYRSLDREQRKLSTPVESAVLHHEAVAGDPVANPDP